MKAKLFILIIIAASNLQAKGIDIVKLKSFYQNWINAASEQPLTYKNLQKIITRDEISFYAVNFDPQGFIIVSGDDKLLPIIGYSKSGYASPDSIPPQLKQLLFESVIMSKKLADNIEYSARVYDEWVKLKSLNAGSSDNRLKKLNAKGPLLTTEWGQGEFYNELCPADWSSTVGNEHVWTGCVATAMAQILNYFEHPSKGYGTRSYETLYGIINADYAGTTYNWDLMPDNLDENSSAEQVNSVAELMLHCGASVFMNYSPTESSANSLNVISALKNFFSYSFFTSGLSYSSQREESWTDIIKKEIDSERPVYYGVFDDTKNAGHAFVCDGYDDNNFLHCNWGWNGNYNGYYSILNMAPSDYNFSSQHYIIESIEPIRRIETDTLLTGENVITMPLELEPNVSLKIAPGSKIIFDEDKYIISRGNIECKGTSEDSIYFYSSNQLESWHGILQLNYLPTKVYTEFDYCVFKNVNTTTRSYNSQLNQGGALYLGGAVEVKVDNAKFEMCEALNGGAINFFSQSHFDSSIELNKVAFNNNQAEAGASLYLSSVNNIKIYDCKFLENNSIISPALYISGCDSLNIEDSEFTRNLSSNGGIISLNGVNISQITTNAFNNNESGNSSILNTSKCDSVYISNSGFFNNSVSSSSIINLSEQSYSSISNNSFIKNNYLNESVDIFYNESDSNFVYNCLFVHENPNKDAYIVSGNGSFFDFSFNFTNTDPSLLKFSGTSIYKFNINGDPGIVTDAEDYYSFKDVSQGINRGNPYLQPDYSTDLKGNARITGSTIDIGCIEHNRALITPIFDIYPKDSINFALLTDNKAEYPISILNIDNPDLTLNYEGITPPFEAVTSDDLSSIILSASSRSPGLAKDTLDIVTNISTISVPLKASFKYNNTKSGFWDDDTILIFGHIYVKKTDTLHIKGNSNIVFKDSYRLLVEGTLVVEDSVTFTTESDSILWNGITFLGENSGSKISGVTFKNIAKDFIPIKITSSSNIEISDCKFENLDSPYIIYCASSDNIKISGNTFSNCKGYYTYFADCSGLKIERNLFSNNKYGGVWIRNGRGGYTIESNKFESASNALWMSNGKGGEISNNLFTKCDNSVYVIGNSPKFINNTFMFHITENNLTSFNKPFMIRENSVVTLINNIFHSENIPDDDQAVFISMLSSSAVEFYNCCINGGYKRLIVDSDKSFTGVYQGIINADPGFIDGAYTLAPSSLCIDAGNSQKFSDLLPETDITGSARIYNNEIDIGAYEYVGEVIPNPANQPTDYNLLQNYPNPANPKTTIRFEVPFKSFVEINLYNIIGEKISTLISTNLDAGEHSITLETALLSSGVYIYTMQTDSYSASKKLVILK